MAELEPGFGPGEGADASPEPEDDAVETEVETEEAEDQESEADSPPADEENVEKKTDPFSERIDKLTRRFRETERDLDQVRQEREQLQRKLDEITASRPEPARTLEDFNYDEGEYRQYLLTEAEKRAEQAAERVLKGFSEKTKSDEVIEQYTQREKEFSKTAEDYHEVVYADDLKISPLMAAEIRESELGPQLAYHLGKNPDKAAQIAGLSERAAVKEMVRLEEQLRRESQKTAKKVSDAPPPPATKVGKGSSAPRVSTADPESDRLSDEEWFRREEARKAKLRG